MKANFSSLENTGILWFASTGIRSFLDGVGQTIDLVPEIFEQELVPVLDHFDDLGIQVDLVIAGCDLPNMFVRSFAIGPNIMLGGNLAHGFLRDIEATQIADLADPVFLIEDDVLIAENMTILVGFGHAHEAHHVVEGEECATRLYELVHFHRRRIGTLLKDIVSDRASFRHAVAL